MLPKHRFAALVEVTSTTALDTIHGHLSTVSNTDDTSRRGLFFALLHIDDIDALVPWSKPYIQFLNDTYHNAFVDNESITVEKALALTKQRSRQKLQQLISEARTLSMNSVSYTLGVVNGYDVHLTNFGKNKAHLLHALKAEYEEEPRYRWIDIIGEEEGDDEVLEVSIVSGRMQPKDTLFVATESVHDAIGLDKLQHIISRSSLDGCRVQLEKALSTVGGRLSYGALLLRPAVEQIAANLPAYRADQDDTTTEDSMKRLQLNQQSAVELIDPKRAPSPLKSAVAKLKQINSKEAEPTPTPKSILPQPSMISNMTKRSVGSVKANLATYKNIDRRDAVLHAKRMHGWFLDYLVSRLRALPHSSQRLLLIALLLAYLFTQSLVFLADRQAQEMNLASATQTVESIQILLDEAESSLIFNNDTQTASRLLEAESLIASLPTDSRSSLERQRLLGERATSLRQRLEKVFESETKHLASLTENSGNPVFMALSKGNLYLTTSNGKISKISSAGELTVIDIAGSTVLSPTSLFVDEAENIYLTNHDGAVISLEITKSSLQVKPIADNQKYQAMAMYLNRFYALSTTDRQIYRYANDSTLTNPNPWVNGNANMLTDATSLVVDGNVYVLNKKGQLFKFTRGSEQNWSASPPYTATTSMTKLTSPTNSDYLYGLDSEKQRIIMWSKNDGKLINQFAFPSIGVIKDFTVSNDNQLFYILTDGAVVTAAIVK